MSQMMDTQTVAKIAYLSRLASNPSPEFLEKYSVELESIVYYVAELQEVDTSQITDVLSSSRVVFIDDLAEDEPYADKQEFERIRQNIIDRFPNKQGDLLVLPGIFEN